MSEWMNLLTSICSLEEFTWLYE